MELRHWYLVIFLSVLVIGAIIFIWYNVFTHCIKGRTWYSNSYEEIRTYRENMLSGTTRFTNFLRGLNCRDQVTTPPMPRRLPNYNNDLNRVPFVDSSGFPVKRPCHSRILRAGRARRSNTNTSGNNQQGQPSGRNHSTDAVTASYDGAAGRFGGSYCTYDFPSTSGGRFGGSYDSGAVGGRPFAPYVPSVDFNSSTSSATGAVPRMRATSSGSTTITNYGSCTISSNGSLGGATAGASSSDAAAAATASSSSAANASVAASSNNEPIYIPPLPEGNMHMLIQGGNGYASSVVTDKSTNK